LQKDLNRYTRKHLDFFYRDILKFETRNALPDKAFLIIEIQKQLEKYLIKKGLKVKDGKDENKQEILFALDDEIVANKAQVAETRALYINNLYDHDSSFAEGVYMATNITMADGVDKPFGDDQPKNFPTLGGKTSRYILPRSGLAKPYPNARLGFILASPVLFLNEGTWIVTITLQCLLDEAICNGNANLHRIYDDVVAALNSSYYYISEDLIQELLKKGVDNELIKKLQHDFLTDIKKECYGEKEINIYDSLVEAGKFESWMKTAGATLPEEVIRKRKPLKILFSGEKEWIEPEGVPETLFTLSPGTFSNQFELKIEAVLNPDKPAVTFTIRRT
jgi:hypothetical protein